MFQLGKKYKTQEGKTVKIIETNRKETHPDYHAVKGDDGAWRYSRDSDMGRCTASNFDMSDPKNLVVPQAFKEEIRLRKIVLKSYQSINNDIRKHSGLSKEAYRAMDEFHPSSGSYVGLENYTNNAHEFVKDPKAFVPKLR
jgi:hypothetical protein